MPLVTFPDLPGGMADGAIILEAVENGHDAVQSWILTPREFGVPVPERL
jgi:predicted RNase H-like HicB family nuclease